MRSSPVERVAAANRACATIRSTRHRTIATMPGQRQPLVSSDTTTKKGRSSRPLFEHAHRRSGAQHQPSALTS
ncbi:hypothetical protein, partial [Burkholderia vietnamiensis]|uniref:hypothetical protein n=1 Tax=Burkholderia vietnamiensis TaxID=60552 RepID=UPI0030C85739